ncbi:hypothetical protein ACFV5G_37570, partial [Streptomyces sp. NPDC059766]
GPPPGPPPWAPRPPPGGRGGWGGGGPAGPGPARTAPRRTAAADGLELVADPLLTTVVFGCAVGDGTPAADESALNAAVRRGLMADGRALLARTNVAGPDGTPRVRLKLVFLNPTTTEDDIDALLGDVSAMARELADRR